MKKIQKILAVLAVTMFLLTLSMPPVKIHAATNETEPSIQYEDGYEDGYHEGWKDGFKVGEESGYEAGYEVGYEDGCDSGYEAGVEAGVFAALEATGCEDEGVKESVLNSLYWERYISETPEGEVEYSDYLEFYTE